MGYRDKIALLEDQVEGYSGNGIGSGPGFGPGDGSGNATAGGLTAGSGDGSGIIISEEDKKKLDIIKAKEQKDADIKAEKAKIKKFESTSDQKDDEKKENTVKPDASAKGQLPALSA